MGLPVLWLFPENISLSTPYSRPKFPRTTPRLASLSQSWGTPVRRRMTPDFCYLAKTPPSFLQIRWPQAQVVMDRPYNHHINDDIVRSFHHVDLLTISDFILALFVV